MRYLIIVLALVNSAIAQTVPTHVPSLGLVAWWPFNGNALDESGNGHNGIVNGAALTSDRFGVLSSAYSFDGINDNISAGNFNLTNDFTLSFWCKLNSMSFQYPIGFGINYNNTVSNFKGYGIGYASINPPCSLNPSRFFTFDGASTCSNVLQQTSTPLINAWANITVTKVGNQVRMYFNGAADAYGTNLNLPGIFALYFGSRSDNYLFSNSHLDDIGIWNRALSEEEVNLLYLGCTDSLSSQPQNFTAFSSPGWANFTCKSTDTTALYQWQLNSGTGWNDLSNFGNYTGTNTDSLVINGITTAMNNFGYRCIVDGCSSDTSDVGFLSVANGIGLGECSLLNLTASPNPTRGMFRLGNDVHGYFELFSLDGRIIEFGKARRDYDLSELIPGTYYLSIQTPEEIRVFKIFKL